MNFLLITIRYLILTSIIYLGLYSTCYSDVDYYSVDNNVIVNAIYKSEGGSNTKYPYGIVSIDTNGNEEYARKICYNTVRNNKKRFKNQSIYNDYIEFLGSRYAPIGVSNDPTNLNKNWIKNVKYFINQEVI